MTNKQQHKQQLWSKLLTFANQSCEQQTYVFFRQFSSISRWIHGCVKESTNTVVYDKVCRMSPPMLRIKQQRHQHKRDGFVLRSRLKSVNVRVAKHTGLPSFYSKLICTGQQRRSFDTRTTCWHWDHHCLLHCTTRGHVGYWSTSTIQVRKMEMRLMSS